MPADLRVRGGGLLRSELGLLFTRRRTVALLVALAGIPALMAVAVRLSSPPQPGQGPPFLELVTSNGLFIGLAAVIVAVPFFVPLTVAVVAGDSVAGEASHGTLRYLLVAPAGRVRLLAVKAAAVAAFCLAAPATVALVGAGLGGLFFGFGPSPTLSGTTVSAPEVAGRLALVVVHVAVSMLGLAAVGVLASTLTDLPIGAMAAVLVASIAAQILGSLSQVAWLHPYLFSRYWLDVGDLFRDPVAWGSFTSNLWLQAAWVAVAGALAYARFTTKDVLS